MEMVPSTEVGPFREVPGGEEDVMKERESRRLIINAETPGVWCCFRSGHSHRFQPTLSSYSRLARVLAEYHKKRRLVLGILTSYGFGIHILVTGGLDGGSSAV